jgi:hypothetical protein
MADKPEFVDLISDRTRQNWRRPVKQAVPTTPEVVVEEKRLSHWPPDRMEQWRLVNLTPWKIKLKSWKFKDWV